MDRTYADLLPHLAAAFPHLDLRGLRPLASGWASEVYRTDGGFVMRVAKHALAWEHLQQEQRLLPLIAGDLAAEVARITDLAPPSERSPLGVAVHRMLEGVPAGPGDMTEAVAGDLGRFFAALHHVPLERAGAGGVRALEAAAQSLAWAEAVTPAVEDGEVRDALGAWLVGVRDGVRFASGPLVLCHFDAWSENLLLRDGRLAGVLDWGDAVLAPPAAEFAAISYYGPAFTLEVAEAYRAAGGSLPDGWREQARDYLVYRELRGLHTAATSESEEMADSLRKLRVALLEYEVR